MAGGPVGFLTRIVEPILDFGLKRLAGLALGLVLLLGGGVWMVIQDPDSEKQVVPISAVRGDVEVGFSRRARRLVEQILEESKDPDRGRLWSRKEVMEAHLLAAEALFQVRGNDSEQARALLEESLHHLEKAWLLHLEESLGLPLQNLEALDHVTYAAERMPPVPDNATRGELIRADNMVIWLLNRLEVNTGDENQRKELMMLLSQVRMNGLPPHHELWRLRRLIGHGLLEVENWRAARRLLRDQIPREQLAATPGGLEDLSLALLAMGDVDEAIQVAEEWGQRLDAWNELAAELIGLVLLDPVGPSSVASGAAPLAASPVVAGLWVGRGDSLSLADKDMRAERRRQLLTMARARLARGQGESAEKALKRLVRDYPGTSDWAAAQYLLGQRAFKRGDLDQAMARFRQVAEQPLAGRIHNEAILFVGEISRLQGDLAAARQHLESLRQRDLHPAIEFATRVALADVMTDYGRLEQAAQGYLEAIDLAQKAGLPRTGLAPPGNGLEMEAWWARCLGDKTLEKEEQPGAQGGAGGAGALLAAAAADGDTDGPESPLAGAEGKGGGKEERGVLPVAAQLFAAGRFEAAAGVYRRLIDLGERKEAYYFSWSEAWAALAAQSEQRGQARNAFDAWRSAARALHRLQADGVTTNRLGDALYLAAQQFSWAGDWVEATRAMRRFIEHAGDDQRLAQAYHQLGEGYARLGLFDRAMESFRRNIALFPESVFAFRSQLSLALARYARNETGDREASLASLLVILDGGEFPPTTQVWRDALYHTARIQFELGEIGDALASMSLFMQRYPRDPRWSRASYQMGVALFQAKRLGQAADRFQDAARSARAGDAVHRYAIFLEADCRFFDGDVSGALSVYTRGLDLYFDGGHLPWVFYQIARCHEALREPEDAQLAYRRALRALRRGGTRAAAAGTAQAASVAGGDTSMLEPEHWRTLLEWSRARAAVKDGGEPQKVDENPGEEAAP